MIEHAARMTVGIIMCIISASFVKWDAAGWDVTRMSIMVVLARGRYYIHRQLSDDAFDFTSRVHPYCGCAHRISCAYYCGFS